MTTNCYRCGEEREVAGHICQPCLDEVRAEEMKESENPVLSPSEAIMAMLNGEELDRDYGVIEKWNGEHFVYRIMGEEKWTRKPVDGEFKGLRRFSKPSFKLLKPRDALNAMLDGAVLFTHNGDEVNWNKAEQGFVFVYNNAPLARFDRLCMKVE